MKKLKKYILLTAFLSGMISFSSCLDDYLDIVPDNIASIDNAFSMRVTAERFLFTCYSWLPNDGDLVNSPALMSADELWAVFGVNSNGTPFEGKGMRLAREEQNVVDPYLNYWDGTQNGTPLFRAIRECNIFLDNVAKVPDLEEYERDNWIGEVLFLKAYYHFLLLRMYGPIPITDVNLPISSSVDEVKVRRESIDKCFKYIIETIDKAMDKLPEVIVDNTTQKGRIDQCVAKSIKAQILVYAASPFYNGNIDYVNFVDQNGETFFNQKYDPEKWKIAAEACKEAIDFCEQNGFALHYYKVSGAHNYKQSTINQLSYREALTEKTNKELIWGNVKARFGGGIYQQPWCIARGVIGPTDLGGTNANCSPTLKMVETFYTVNGVPLEEDKTRNYANRYHLRTVRPEESLNLINGYITADLNFDREDRFYGALGFDGGKLFGQGKTDENDLYKINMKVGQSAGVSRVDAYNITGYFPKKLVNYQTIIRGDNCTARGYAWPIMRLANLYLLYAEASNEFSGPNDEIFRVLDLIRARAGLDGVKESWTNYSKKPQKFNSKEGLRDIIRQERTIELMFEGQRYWDLRRWKLATKELNQPVKGWNVLEKTEEGFYKPVILWEQTFSQKQYLWPIKEYSLQINRNLIQNPGW